jgi:hypothetical protein
VSLWRHLGVGASREPRRRGCHESDEYVVKGVCEAFPLDRQRRPGRCANGKGAGKIERLEIRRQLIGQDGGGLGRTEPPDGCSSGSGWRQGGADGAGEEEARGGEVGGGGIGEEEAGGDAWPAAKHRAGWLSSVVMKREG